MAEINRPGRGGDRARHWKLFGEAASYSFSVWSNGMTQRASSKCCIVWSWRGRVHLRAPCCWFCERLHLGSIWLWMESLGEPFSERGSRCALTTRSTVRVGVVATKLLYGVTFRADILVVLSVPLDDSLGLGAVAASDLSNTGMWGATLINQPARHASDAGDGVHYPAAHRVAMSQEGGDQAFGRQIEPGFASIQHGRGRADLSLPNGSRGFDIDNQAKISVDPIKKQALAKECEEQRGS